MTSSYFTADDDTISVSRPPDLTDDQWRQVRESVAGFLERAGWERVAA